MVNNQKHNENIVCKRGTDIELDINKECAAVTKRCSNYIFKLCKKNKLFFGDNSSHMLQKIVKMRAESGACFRYTEVNVAAEH